jgi:hypothetical protein
MGSIGNWSPEASMPPAKSIPKLKLANLGGNVENPFLWLCRNGLMAVPA